MGKDTAISWTDHTFNPWWGCVRVSPGCEHCYAEAFAKRTGHAVWGVTSERRRFGDKHWTELLKWDREAKLAGERRRVFCASMADVFEKYPLPPAHAPQEARDRALEIAEGMREDRERFFGLIPHTTNLDYLLLTKRPENIRDLVPAHWLTRGMPPNVWFGTTVEDRPRARERIQHLVRLRAAVTFLSCEPLLEDIAEEVAPFLGGRVLETNDGRWLRHPHPDAVTQGGTWWPGIDWAIVGGESGGGARGFDYAWARRLRDACATHGARFFFKQAGARPNDESRLVRLRNRKGDDLAEIPEDLRIQQFPRAA